MNSYILHQIIDALVAKRFDAHDDLDFSLIDEQAWRVMLKLQALGSSTLRGEEIDLYCTKMLLAPLQVM